MKYGEFANGWWAPRPSLWFPNDGVDDDDGDDYDDDGGDDDDADEDEEGDGDGDGHGGHDDKASFDLIAGLAPLE